jgi:hypothetical protein
VWDFKQEITAGGAKIRMMMTTRLDTCMRALGSAVACETTACLVVLWPFALLFCPPRYTLHGSSILGTRIFFFLVQRVRMMHLFWNLFFKFPAMDKN